MSTIVVPDIIKNKHLFGFMETKFNLSDASKDLFDVTNPATGEILAKLPSMGGQEAEHAASIAMSSWKEWKNTTGKERSKIISKMSSLMTKYQDDLATIITLESGKPFAEAKGEVLYAASFYDFYAEEAKRIYGQVLPPPVKGRRLITTKEPVGPAGLITPWNFPCAMITRKLGPALAAGCTAVIKPAEETPLSALALCAIAAEAGVPPGVVNCLTVARKDVETVGLVMCESTNLRKISFTGSTAVGKVLMRQSASTVKKLSLELGGNAPFIVFDDANLDTAVRATMAAKFRNAGQACIAANRILVQEGIYERYVEALSKSVSKMVCGNGLERDVTVGPLINHKALEKVASHTDDCIRTGASVAAGGTGSYHKSRHTSGSYYLPTVLTNVSLASLPFAQETFGPVAPVLSFKTEDEAIAIANDTRFGLAGYACTSDLSRAFRVADRIETGMVGINEGAISTDGAPFGGVKESGLGREGSHEGLDEYLEVKYICFGSL